MQILLFIVILGLTNILAQHIFQNLHLIMVCWAYWHSKVRRQIRPGVQRHRIPAG